MNCPLHQLSNSRVNFLNHLPSGWVIAGGTISSFHLFIFLVRIFAKKVNVSKFSGYK